MKGLFRRRRRERVLAPIGPSWPESEELERIRTEQHRPRKYSMPTGAARVTLTDVILIAETAIAFQTELGEHYQAALGSTVESCLAEALGHPQHRCWYPWEHGR